MLRFARSSLVFGSLTAIALSSHAARAQTTAPTTTATATTTTAPTVTAALNQSQPNRIVNGVNKGISTRPIQLTPNGISYEDCISDMVLQFPLVLTNFTASSASLQVWVGSTNCAFGTNRGVQSPPACWLVATPTVPIAGATSISQSVSVRVQDIVGHVTSVPTTMTYVPVGREACSTQTVDSAEMLSIFFVPTSPTGQDIGGVTYSPPPIVVDMVGPSAPATPGDHKSGAGDTLLVPTWTPNVDPDTIGYDIYIDPIPGQEATVGGVGSEPVLVCPAAGPAAVTPADAGNGGDGNDTGASADTGASIDAGTAPAPTTGNQDACVLEIRGTSSATGAGGVCSSSVLSNASSVVFDAAAPVTPVAEASSDDATDTDAELVEASTASPGGGISMVDPKYLYKPDPSTGITVGAMTASSYNITGLRNDVQYNVAIAGVDALGNVGPLSTLECASPGPINDFWDVYRASGGQAGGGFCALEAPGAPAGSAILFGGAITVAAAALRRRRRKQR